MKNLFKNLSEEDKKKALNRMLWTFGITVFFIGCFFLIFPQSNFFVKEKIVEGNYTFIINEEEINSIMVCENNWHYELIEGFIPCVINNTMGGITGKTINWSESPQVNCEKLGGGFPGLNLYNETRAKELYDNLLPKCFELKEEEITYIWLNASNCMCLDSKYSEEKDFVVGCKSYDCGGGLVVKKKKVK